VLLHIIVIVPFVFGATPPERQIVYAINIGIAPAEGDTLDEDMSEESLAQDAVAAAVKEQADTPDPVDPIEAVHTVDDTAEVMEAKKEEEKKKEEQQKSEVDQKEQAAADDAFKKHMGVENGVKENAGMTSAEYASLVKKEIEKKRKRPDKAMFGIVNVAFCINKEGRAENISIVKSTKHELEPTARMIIAAIEVPPPPGGIFAGTIAIKFE
jgi:outer membrane biosynthesis protein TonB